MNNIFTGMCRFGPLQCNCGLTDIGGPEIAGLRGDTCIKTNKQTDKRMKAQMHARTHHAKPAINPFQFTQQIFCKQYISL